MSPDALVRLALRSSAAAALVAGACGVAAQSVPILQPGAPGQPTVTIPAKEAVRIADTRFSPDDVRFMQDMILHHRQAVEMAALVNGRTNRQAVIDLAKRIDASQDDEIAFMAGWLRERGQVAPDAAMHSAHAAHGSAATRMKGMATPQQMAALAAVKGAAFDRLFLERMIAHHDGAVKMANDLLKRAGSAHDPALFEFVNEVINEQEAEIERMSALLAGLADDPRSTLAAGATNAGQAIRNMRLLASLPKPAGFFDPANPSNLPRPKPAKPGEAKDKAADAKKKKDSANQRAAAELRQHRHGLFA